MKATHRLIDSVWTVEFNLNEKDNTAEILRYSRNDEEGYQKEYQLPKGWLKEDDDRTVTALVLNTNRGNNGAAKQYAVTNPKYIFSYGA